MQRFPDRACVPDPTAFDAGPDTGPPDAGACGVCPTETPVCDQDAIECVECLFNTHCAVTNLCDPAARQCVQCGRNEDCTDPRAPICNSTGACEASCAADQQCAHFQDTPACNTATGQCVECNVDEFSECTDAQTCDLVTSTCADVPPRSRRELCDPCTNDLQCAEGRVCVRMEYEGHPHGVGGYCMYRVDAAPSGGCPRPYSFGTLRPTLNSALRIEICNINEALTTCEAVFAFEHGWTCNPSHGEGRCIPIGAHDAIDVPGAVCKRIDTQDRCTVLCQRLSNIECGGDAPMCATSEPVPYCTVLPPPPR